MLIEVIRESMLYNHIIKYYYLKKQSKSSEMAFSPEM